MKNIALVGRGICFDTSGHNFKPARYMNGMHEKIADIKQCTLDSEADPVPASWSHVDLSSSNRKEGLGALACDVNGFGVGFGVRLIQTLLE